MKGKWKTRIWRGACSKNGGKYIKEKRAAYSVLEIPLSFCFWVNKVGKIQCEFPALFIHSKFMDTLWERDVGLVNLKNISVRSSFSFSFSKKLQHKPILNFRL